MKGHLLECMIAILKYNLSKILWVIGKDNLFKMELLFYDGLYARYEVCGEFDM